MPITIAKIGSSHIAELCIVMEYKNQSATRGVTKYGFRVVYVTTPLSLGIARPQMHPFQGRPKPCFSYYNERLLIILLVV